MYYRRKILLALIEVFGGSLQSTDCEKLLFAFCQWKHPFEPQRTQRSRRENARKFTALSPFVYLVSFVFRLCPVNYGRALNTKHSYLNELTPADKTALLKFKAQIGDLRGDKLVKKIYREFPQYTSRSKIAGRHGAYGAINQLQFAWNTDTKPAVFSIGYEGLTIDSFLNKLIATH